MAPHYQDDSIIIHKYECGDFGNNAYLVVCPQTNESIIIDTPGEPGKVIEAAKSTDVKGHTDYPQSLGPPPRLRRRDERHRRAGWHRRGRRRRASPPTCAAAARRRRDRGRYGDAAGRRHAGAHARLDVLHRRQRALFWRYPLSRRTRKVRLARKAAATHRQHHHQAVRPGRRRRRIPRPRFRRRPEEQQRGACGLRV